MESALITVMFLALAFFVNRHFTSQEKEIKGIKSELSKHADEEGKYLKSYHDVVTKKIDKLSGDVVDSSMEMVKVQHKINQEILEIHKEFVEVSIDKDDIRKIKHDINNLKQAVGMVHNSVKDMKLAQESHLKDNLLHLKKA